MEQPGSVAPFSLLGGPLYRLGRRWGLIRGAANTFPLGLALGLGCWIPLATLALIEGDGDRLFSLSMIAAHFRLLLVIPLLFLGEAWTDPRMATFVDTIVRSGVVPAAAVPALEAEIERVARRKDSWIPEAVCLAGAVLWSLFGRSVGLTGAVSVTDPSGHAARMLLPAHWWYWFVCLPLFFFLVLRWLWRLGLWSRFLWRLAKLDLQLIPTHPDGAGGLGFLEVVHTHFIPLIVAISAVQSAGLAEEIATGTMPFEGIYPVFLIILVIDAVVFVGPMLLFTPKLWRCRVRGLSEYMEFASSYVGGFDRKWLRAGPPPGETLLGTPDLQSLADLANSIKCVREMRLVPLTVTSLRDFVIVVLLPAVPLLLLKYPVAELMRRFSDRLMGL